MILEQTISNKHKNLDLVRKSNRNFKFVKMVVIMLITSVGLISTVPVLAYAQQQQQTTNFVANLSGKDVQPTPVNTPATGTAKFQLNQNGTMSYEVDAKNLDKVIDASIDYKNTTEVVSLINPYATVSTGFNQVKSIYPTGPINGKLTDGVITSNKLMAGLEGKNVTDLANTMKGGSLNVVIRTQPHQDGEIAGQIGPSK
ncbi:MAG TPA: CHRD domain-containing protein [Candidatus Sulfopaludibacter sp.]|jgi:competence protein ComGC|nr:CHRD domain-containing protein [Candidatus Sulfopaludibacter sp.]